MSDKTRINFCSVHGEQPSKIRSKKRLKIKVSADSSHCFPIFFCIVLPSKDEKNFVYYIIIDSLFKGFHLDRVLSFVLELRYIKST